MRALDGLRALSMLWMVAFHTVFFTGFFVSRADFLELVSNPWLRPFTHGHLGVDVFFVLSGTLIAGLLFAEQRRDGRIAIGRFYLRRFLRLVPVYVVVLGIYAVTLREQRHMCWTNLLYINNFWPTKEQCMGWAWSLAIEEQFYLTLPVFLLGFFLLRRGRLALLLGLLALAFVIRAVVIHRGGDAAAEALHPILDTPSYLWAFDAIYDKPHTRYGGLLVGVIVAYLAQFTNVPRALAASRRSRWALGVSAAALVVPVVAAFDYTTTSYLNADPAAFAFAVGGRYVFSLGVGLLVLLAMSDGTSRPSTWRRVLGWRGFYPIAQLSYSGYLVHPIVIAAGYFFTVRQGALALPVGLYYVLFTSITLALATVLYLGIERPFMNLRRPAAPAPETAPSPAKA